jgi:hypothetical protein
MKIKPLFTKSKTKKTAPVGHKKLKLLITVVNRNKAEFFVDLLQGYEVNFQMRVLAKGTAKSETLHLLGLEDEEKCVIFSVIREDKADEILHVLQDKFTSVRGGKGIAFTTPLSSVIGVTTYGFLSNNKTVVKENKDE